MPRGVDRAAVEIAEEAAALRRGALAPGTCITVRDLFYNVPARKKFLRSEQTELAHIASLVTHYSLAHPDKRFELRHGTSELLCVTPVETMRDRVYQVFGNQTLDDVVDLGVRERELTIPRRGAAIVGAARRTDRRNRRRIARLLPARLRLPPQIQKLNRNSIFLFVNGRLIRDRLLLHAISSAYYNLIPGGTFPFALLFLDCDAEEVDVNVHPSKTEVRFRHGTVVHDFVRDSIRETLIESRPIPRSDSGGDARAGRDALAVFRIHAAIENQQMFQPPSELPPNPARRTNFRRSPCGCRRRPRAGWTSGRPRSFRRRTGSRA